VKTFRRGRGARYGLRVSQATRSQLALEPDRFELVHASHEPARSTRDGLAEDVRHGLGAPSGARSIPPKHFYDAAGSALFDRICELPEYYLTRVEHRLLQEHASAIVAATGATELVELGSGMARKTGALLEAMARVDPSPAYVSFDISQDALEQAAPLLLEAVPSLRMRAVVGDFTQDLGILAAPSSPPREPRPRHRSARAASHPGARGSRPRRLFAFLGSTLGNMDEIEAPALLRSIADAMSEGDSFLLGVDLAKDEAVLHAAYNDSAGVTAAFNKNVLAVVNRELGADFDLDAWDHDARFDALRSRIEMYLVARRAQVVHVADLGLSVEIEAGERILTEISRKFTRASIESTLAQGGLQLDRWISDGAFALVLARRARGTRYSSAAM
jgi:L-histidine N-alpha-methyltransferase